MNAAREAMRRTPARLKTLLYAIVGVISSTLAFLGLRPRLREYAA